MYLIHALWRREEEHTFRTGGSINRKKLVKSQAEASSLHGKKEGLESARGWRVSTFWKTFCTLVYLYHDSSSLEESEIIPPPSSLSLSLFAYDSSSLEQSEITCAAPPPPPPPLPPPPACSPALLAPLLPCNPPLGEAGGESVRSMTSAAELEADVRLPSVLAVLSPRISLAQGALLALPMLPSPVPPDLRFFRRGVLTGTRWHVFMSLPTVAPSQGEGFVGVSVRERGEEECLGERGGRESEREKSEGEGQREGWRHRWGRHKKEDQKERGGDREIL